MRDFPLPQVTAQQINVLFRCKLRLAARVPEGVRDGLGLHLGQPGLLQPALRNLCVSKVVAVMAISPHAPAR
jgi:hypothetical protein